MRIKINDVSLNCELSGSGRTLSLIHGMGNSLSLWELVLPQWTKHFQVLAYDVRGHGQSDKHLGPYSAKMFVNDHYLLLKALHIEKNFILGFSMGGVIALQFALEHPEMTDALVVVSSSSEVSEKAIAMYEERAALVEQQGMETIASIVDTAFTPDFARQNPSVVAQYREILLQNHPEAYAAAARAMIRYNLTAKLGKISCPTLVIVGEKDISVGVGGSVIINRHIPNSKLTILPEAGHIIMQEKPDDCADQLLSAWTILHQSLQQLPTNAPDQPNAFELHLGAAPAERGEFEVGLLPA